MRKKTYWLLSFILLNFFTVSLYAQNIKVTGMVENAQGDALPGVTITIKNSNVHVISDSKGEFTLSVKDDKAVIVFTHVGFDPLTQEVGNKRQFSIVLNAKNNALNEVVVMGYGAVRKKDLTGSVGIVNMNDLTKAPVASFDNALQGRIAGVQITSNDGQPGSGMNIMIRGVGSLTQSTAPLYVIDGFPIENFDPADLNPGDIASITVLKDASATAIYGARGSNGVIVIETKKGKSGKPVLSYNGSYGIDKVTKRMDMMDPYEFIKFNLERSPALTIAVYFPTLAPGATPDPSVYKNVPGIDWQDKIFRSGNTQIHGLSLTGGNKDTKYAVSGSIFNQDGAIINTQYRRYEGRFALDQVVSPRLTAGVNVNYSRSKASGAQPAQGFIGGSATSGLFFSTWGYRPIASPLPTDNSLLEQELLDPTLNAGNDFRINPVLNLQNTLLATYNGSILANAYFNFKIMPNLFLRVQGGINTRDIESDYFYNSKTSIGVPRPGIAALGVQGGISSSEVNIWSNENTLNYTKDFNKNNHLEVVAGLSMQDISTKSHSLATTNIPNEQLGLSGLDQGLPLSTASLLSESALQSAFGRVNYTFKSRYLFTATFRADGSSKFAPENRWGYFPSGAVAWRMSDESFMKRLSFVTDAKLRVSYGATGNNRVGDFSYLSSITLPISSYYSFDNQVPSLGAIPSQLGNANLRWETSRQTDIGYDLSLFKSRVALTVDVYRKTTNDLLLNANLPLTSGYSTALKNIGSIQNDGLEISLNTVNVQTNHFKWETDFNISFYRNKVLALNDGQPQLLSTVSWDGNYNTPLYRAKVGGPAAEFYGILFDGIYQYGDFDKSTSGVYTLKAGIPTNGNPRANIYPGDVKYKDINGDGIVNASDQTGIGRALPIHTGGIGNNFDYKRFHLNVFLQWSYGNDIFNANRIYFEGGYNVRPLQNQFASYANRWEPDNPSNTMVRASAGSSPSSGAGPNGVLSSMDIEDGSYLRLKTVSLDYSLPEQLLKKAGINNLSLSVAAQNLYTWTNYSGMDPEVSVRNTILTPGFDFSAYPRAKTIVFSIKATF